MTHRARTLKAIWEVVIIAILSVGLVAFTGAFLFLMTLEKRGYSMTAIAEIEPTVWRYSIAAFLILSLFFVLLYFAYLREAVNEYTSLYVMTVTREGKIMSINKAAPGFDKKKVLGSKIYQYIPEKSLGIAQRALKKTFTTSKPTEYDIESVGADGRLIYYRSVVEPVMLDGKVIAALFMSRVIHPSDAGNKRVVKL